MVIELSDTARQYISTFEAETGARAVDCLADADRETVIFVVPPDDMADAIGPGGQTVDRLETRLDARVILVEDAEFPEDFVANALAPAAVYEVRVADDDGGTQVATAVVDAEDMGVAIGPGGERIQRARRLAGRHFGIDEIELESTEGPPDPAKDDA